MDYVDTSNTSLGVGFFVFLLTVFIVFYLREDTENKQDNLMRILYSVVAGIVLGVLTLIGFKQFGNRLGSGSNDILTEPFSTKISSNV